MFLERCFYQPGQYASEEDFSALSERLSKVEKVRASSAACAEFCHVHAQLRCQRFSVTKPQHTSMGAHEHDMTSQSKHAHFH